MSWDSGRPGAPPRRRAGSPSTQTLAWTGVGRVAGTARVGSESLQDGVVGLTPEAPPGSKPRVGLGWKSPSVPLSRPTPWTDSCPVGKEAQAASESLREKGKRSIWCLGWRQEVACHRGRALGGGWASVGASGFLGAGAQRHRWPGWQASWGRGGEAVPRRRRAPVCTLGLASFAALAWGPRPCGLERRALSRPASRCWALSLASVARWQVSDGARGSGWTDGRPP